MVPIIIILFIIISGAIIYKLFNFINAQFKQPIAKQPRNTRPRKTDLNEIYKDISLQPYGCFSSLDEKFFLKQINPYISGNIIDSGIIISEKDDMRDLITRVINNGFDQFGYKMIHKYDKDPNGYSKNMSIKEIGILGKLAGYNYLSIYKLDEHTRGNIYLTYSPPMDDQITLLSSDPDLTKNPEYIKNVSKTDLPNYTLTPKLNNYTNEVAKGTGKEMACGYPCLPNDKPMTFEENGVTKQYMCGSVAFPSIKTPPRFAVYQIVER